VPLLILELLLTPVIAQRMEQHIFGHARGEAGIDQPHDRDMKWQGLVGQQLVDAGAQIEDDLEVGIALHVSGLRQPDQRIVDIFDPPHIRPIAHIEGRIGRQQRLAPSLILAGFVQGAVEENGHQKFLDTLIITKIMRSGPIFTASPRQPGPSPARRRRP
jgi:hypothetical protein